MLKFEPKNSEEQDLPGEPNGGPSPHQKDSSCECAHVHTCVHVCICNCHGYVSQQNNSLHTAPSHSEVRARSSLVSLTTPETKQRQRQMEQERGAETETDRDRRGGRDRVRGRERTFMSESLWRLRTVQKWSFRMNSSGLDPDCPCKWTPCLSSDSCCCCFTDPQNLLSGLGQVGRLCCGPGDVLSPKTRCKVSGKERVRDSEGDSCFMVFI